MRIKRTNDTDENNQRKQLSHDKQFLADPKIEKEFGVKLKIIIDKTKRFDNEYSKHYSIEKKTITAFKKDILEGNIYYDGPAGGDTHHLEKYSKDGIYHMESKCINTVDRLNYLVYPPRLKKNEETGELEYIQRVVLASCKGHYRYGVGTYSEIEK